MPNDKEEPGQEVTAVEDLMREHGVLARILVVYDEAALRLEANRDVPAEALTRGADLVRRFVEDYHERMEENYIFPLFKTGEMAELVKTLKSQHDAGRRVTDDIRRLAGAAGERAAADRANLIQALRSFDRMYRPHKAREDTVLFPQLHSILKADQYEKMGDQFEDEEHKRFGAHGFEDAVAQVAALEKELGIFNLAEFAPR